MRFEGEGVVYMSDQVVRFVADDVETDLKKFGKLLSKSHR